MAEVRYFLENDKIDGLDKILKARRKVKTEDELKAWKKSTAEWILAHPLLGQFDRHEMRFELGSEWTIQIIIDRPHVDVSHMTLIPDFRLALEHIDTIQLTVPFERLPGEPDPRGCYRFNEEGWMTAFVSIKDGKYLLIAELDRAYAEECEQEFEEGGRAEQTGLDVLTEFVLNIIRGALKPTSFQTVTDKSA